MAQELSRARAWHAWWLQLRLDLYQELWLRKWRERRVRHWREAEQQRKQLVLQREREQELVLQIRGQRELREQAAELRQELLLQLKKLVQEHSPVMEQDAAFRILVNNKASSLQIVTPGQLVQYMTRVLANHAARVSRWGLSPSPSNEVQSEMLDGMKRIWEFMSQQPQYIRRCFSVLGWEYIIM